MSTTSLHNRKLPAWIGSILFHTLLLSLILFWFSLPSPNRGVPGERSAVGTIMPQSGGGSRQHPETAPNESDSIDSELQNLQAERIATAVLAERPPLHTLAPGQASGTAQPHGDGASDLASAFQSLSSTGIGNQTGEAAVSFFGAQGKGTKFVYVLDHSGSMDGRRLQRAKAELRQSLEALGETHQFNIIFYNHAFRAFRSGPPRRLVFASQTEKQAALRFIDGITADGGTHHYPPLMEAVAYSPDVIFFLTDGESQDDLSAVQLDAIERANNRLGRGTQIHVIQFGGGGFLERPSRSLQQLAAENHGEYKFFDIMGVP